MAKPKTTIIFAIIFFSVFFFAKASPVFALDVPTIIATAIGPNQINLTWSGVANPGWGYKVEIQNTDGRDTRYASWTNLTASLANQFGYLPYWVTEDHYRDRANGAGTELGTPSQFSAFGLKYNTAYKFRVQTYAKTDTGTAVYGNYSNEAAATTLNATLGGTSGTYKLKWVDYTNGNDNYSGDYETFQGGSNGPWKTIYKASQAATNKTLVLIHGANYGNDRIVPLSSGSGSASRIILQGYPGETVTLNTVSSDRVYFYNINYYVLDSITINDGNGVGDNNIMTLSSSDRNVFANFTLNGPAPNFSATFLGYPPGSYSSNYNMFHNFYIHGYGTPDGFSGGWYWEAGACNWNLFINSRIGMLAHGINFNGGSSYNAVLNSRTNEGGGQLTSKDETSEYNLWEGNIIVEGGKNITSYKPSMQIEGRYHVVRRNVFYGGLYHAIEINWLGHHGQYYNNVIYDTHGLALDMMGGAGGKNHTYNKFYNNIIYNNDGDATGSGWNTPLYVSIQSDSLANILGVEFKNNMILHSQDGIDDPNAAIIYVMTYSYQRSVAQTQADAAANPYFHNNELLAPAFIDATNDEFHLKSTSNGIGKAIASAAVGPWGSPIQAGDDYGAFEYYSTSVSPDTVPPAAPTGVTVN